MKINKRENHILVDVDYTLVHWPSDYESKKRGRVEFDWYGTKVYLEPIPYSIGLVKSYKIQGSAVTVASNNGWRWAKEVVEKLELTPYVYEVKKKYEKCLDDKPPGTWLKHIPVGEITP